MRSIGSCSLVMLSLGVAFAAACSITAPPLGQVDGMDAGAGMGGGVNGSSGSSGSSGHGDGGAVTTDGGSGTVGAMGYAFHAFDGPGDHAGGTTVNGIANSNSIVGFSSNKDGSTLTNFVLAPDGATFTTLKLDSPTAMASGINAVKHADAGLVPQTVVGTSKGAFEYAVASMTETPLPPALPSKAATETALGINDAGAIVGQITAAGKDAATRGFLLVNGAFTDVTPMGAQVTNPQGVNAAGLVVGFFATTAALQGPVVAGNPAQHGFSYDSVAHTYAMLPDPKQPDLFLTQYLGVNDKNQAVGYWQDSKGSQHGFIYDLAAKTFTFVDEPDAAPNAGVSVTQIVGISNAGVLAGFFVDAAGMQRGFFATPK